MEEKEEGGVSRKRYFSEIPMTSIYLPLLDCHISFARFNVV